MKDKDLASSIAGGGAGGALLLTVRWDVVPYGEAVKIAVAVLLIFVGYLMYRKPSDPPPPPVVA